MLAGCTPWPEDYARRYRARGYWEGVSIPAALDAVAAAQPDRIALVHGDVRITYAQLAERIERLAARFVLAGVRPLDRVVLQLPNVPEFLYAYFGLIRAGAIPVMALRAHRHTEVKHFINSAGASAYVIPERLRDFDYRAMAEDLRPACPTLKQVFVHGTPGANQTSLDEMIGAPMTPADARATLASVALEPGEVALMLLSGGTTSVSKLIPRTHDDYVYNARQCARHAAFDADTVLMPILPLAHNYNLASPGLMGALYAGGRVVLAPAGDAETVFPLVERERVTVIPAAVPLISAWLNSDAPEKHDHSSLRIVQNGGARLAPELRARLQRRLGCRAQEIYGTAEGLISMVRLDADREAVLESSGTPVCDDDEIRVLDDRDREVPDGQPGELCVRGPYTIRGYYNARDKNREAFTADGYYRMGDIVRKRGRQLYTEGRRKDIINRGGEKISCDEVENYIFAHPKVKSVTLVAMPDETFGEKACAFVIPKPGETLGFDELIEFLRQRRIASFKLPERLEVVSEFPTSPVGKVLKKELRDRIAAQIAKEKGRA